jgi:hypothetical protein
MNIQQQTKQFWQQGYLVLNEFFSHDLMDELQHLILEHYGLSPEYQHEQAFLAKSATEVIPWFPQRSGVKTFNKIAQSPKMHTISQAILGENWQALDCMTMFSKKGTKGQAWHQDCPPDHPKKFNLNRLVYTMNIDETTGGEVVVIPKSHRMGKLPVGDVNEDFPEQMTLKPTKGTLVIIHGHTWHRVLPIKGDYRVSTNYRAVPHNTPKDITDICVYRNMLYQFSRSEVIEER